MNKKEKETVSLMIRIYCRSKHGNKADLCPSCRELENYAHTHLERCPFKEAKPSCKKCTVHCYQISYRNRIRDIMRFSGPKMIFHHPIHAIRHLLKR